MHRRLALLAAVATVTLLLLAPAAHANSAQHTSGTSGSKTGQPIIIGGHKFHFGNTKTRYDPRTKLTITYYQIWSWYVGSGNNSYCLDDTNAGGDGTRQQIWNCAANTNQQYWADETSGWGIGWHQLVNYDTGLCLDAPNGGWPGQYVQVWSCLQDRAQAWNLDCYRGDPGVHFESGSDFYLDVPNDNLVNGQKVQTWNLNNNNQQDWGQNFTSCG